MNGSVLSFGNNDFGQLGLGDNNPRQGINLIPNLYNTIQISAGSSHFVVKLGTQFNIFFLLFFFG